jgi:hypothetical protein
MSVTAVRALDLSCPVLDSPRRFRSLNVTVGLGYVRDMGSLDNTHYGANNARQVLREIGEAASTAASACAIRKAGSREAAEWRRSKQLHIVIAARWAPLCLSSSACLGRLALA